MLPGPVAFQRAHAADDSEVAKRLAGVWLMPVLALAETAAGAQCEGVPRLRASRAVLHGRRLGALAAPGHPLRLQSTAHGGSL